MRPSFILCLAVLLASALAVGPARDTDPDVILAALDKYYNDAQAKAKEAGESVNYGAVDAGMRAIAVEAIEELDLATVDPKKADRWAMIFVHAEKWDTVLDLCDQFQKTDSSEDRIYYSHWMCLKAYRSMERLRQAADTIGEMPFPKAANLLSVAQMAATVFASGLAKEQGMEAVEEMLSSIESKIPKEGVRLGDRRRYEQARTQLTIGYANAHKAIGGAGMAIEYLESEIVETDDDDVVKALSARIESMRGEAFRDALVGSVAPSLLPSTELGGFNGLRSLQGKVVIVDFFAHWCGPCISSFPDVRKMYDDLKDQGLEIVSVTKYYGYYGSERSLTKEQELSKMPGFVQKHKMNWQIAYAAESVYKEYGIEGIPTAFVIDREGRVSSYKVGYDPATFGLFRKKVEELLKK